MGNLLAFVTLPRRTEIAKRVSDMQSKIVETVVSSMLKNSNMTMDYKDDQLAVIDAEAKKNLKDLASGTSARCRRSWKPPDSATTVNSTYASATRT